MQGVQKDVLNWLNYTKEFKQKAIKMLCEGNSGRAVGRIMGINKSRVYDWVKKAEEKIKSSSCEDERSAELPQPVDVIEMDELFAYIKEKKQGLRDNDGDEKTAPNRRF